MSKSASEKIATKRLTVSAIFYFLFSIRAILPSSFSLFPLAYLFLTSNFLLLSSNLYALRIVSLAPSHTEILYELGLEDEIVGVTNLCDWPERAKLKEKTGDYLNPNAEKIVGLKPDIVFALTSTPATEKLQKMGLRVIYENPQSISEIKQTIFRFGEIAGRIKNAKKLNDRIEKTITGVKTKAKSKKANIRLYTEIHYPPPWSCSKGSFIDEAIKISGFENIFADVNKDYFPVSTEQIIKKNPDVILVLSQSGDLEKRKGYGKIEAVRNKRIIYWQDKNLLVRPTPRMIESIAILQKKVLDFYK